MASVRAGLLVLNLEIFLGLMVLNTVFIAESFNFTVFVIYQETI
jgi:NADH:ubiquinone oxidoreductase subunit H